jgi:hypothetical protein
MSDRLYLRGTCELLFERATPDSIIQIDKSLENYSFSVSNNGQNVKIKLLQDGKTIKFESVVDFFKPNIPKILRAKDYDKLSDGEKTELHGITHPVREGVKRFAGLLKQELHRYDISDGLIANIHYEWSLGDDQWFPVPGGIRLDIETFSLGNLDKKTANHLQELLSEDEEALVATSYLHQARNSMNRRYQWIYATMAAELAIKEVLVRIEPKLQVIIGTLPSPPLNRLYGDVLEAIAGVRSTSLATLQKGAEKRNQLVHNPKSPTPTFNEVNDYVDFIEDKIKWLLEEWRRIKRDKKQQ